jgi:hypothetical protein
LVASLCCTQAAWHQPRVNPPVSDMKRAEKSLAQNAGTLRVRQRESKSESTACVSLFEHTPTPPPASPPGIPGLAPGPAVEPMHVFVMSNVSRNGGKQARAPAPCAAPAVGLACSPPSRRPPTSGSASSSSFADWSSYSDCVKYISKYVHKGRDPIFYDHRPVDEIEDFGRRRHLRGVRFDWKPAPWYGDSSPVPE